MRERGFTLLELLVAVAISVLLMAMLMPMLTMARRSSLRSVSTSILAKTCAGLEQYKADYGAYPYQLSYPSTSQNWNNTLAYNVGTDISPAAAQAVQQDMASGRAAYQYDVTLFQWGWGPLVAGTQSFLENRNDGIDAMNTVWPWGHWPEGDILPSGYQQDSTTQGWYYTYPCYFRQAVLLLNRLGAQRAAELSLIGAVNAPGCLIQGYTPPASTGLPSHPPRDLSGTPIIPSPASLGSACPAPGWAKDYLQGEIESKYLRGTSILDSYFHPLIYICQALPGVEQTWGDPQNTNFDCNVPWYYGLQSQGRKTLQPYNSGTTTPTTTDAYLPDASNLMHSDMRYWAPPGYEMSYELWSAGPDGQLGWWRDDPLNQDNIPAEPYNKLIGQMP